MRGEKRQIMIGIIHNVMAAVIDDGRQYFLASPKKKLKWDRKKTKHQTDKINA